MISGYLDIGICDVDFPYDVHVGVLEVFNGVLHMVQMFVDDFICLKRVRNGEGEMGNLDQEFVETSHHN